MADIESRVKAIIVDKLTVDENEVTPAAEFSKDLGADSLDTVEPHHGVRERIRHHNSR